MGRTVAELDASLSEDEWTDWLAYYSLHPWGCHVEDGRWDNLLRMFFSANRGSNQAIPDTFFDRDWQEKERDRQEQQAAATEADQIRAMFEAMGKTVVVTNGEDAQTS